VGILVEIIGSPVPETIPFVPERQVPGNDQALPVRPGPWSMAQSVSYSLSLARGLLTYAANNREKLLFDRWQMGANAIAKGSTDSWTISRDRIEAAHAALAERGGKPKPVRTRGWSEIDADLYEKILHDPAQRDARAYIVPVDQHDFPTTAKFLTSLSRLGVEMSRAEEPFTAAGKTWPPGHTSCRPRKPIAPMSSTCSSRSITRTTSPIPVARQSRPPMLRGILPRFRQGCVHPGARSLHGKKPPRQRRDRA
jgi:hypothetical protein